MSTLLLPQPPLHQLLLQFATGVKPNGSAVATELKANMVADWSMRQPPATEL